MLIDQNIARQQAEREQIQAQSDPTWVLEQQRLTELQQSLQDELDYYGDRIADLQAQITELEGKPSSAETDQRILSLRQQMVNYQSLRTNIFGSLAQAQAALASNAGGSDSADTIVVIDHAPLPIAPHPEPGVQSILLALAASLGLGVGLAFLIEYLDWTIKTPEELDAVYGMSTLGVIGAIKNGSRDRTGQEGLVTLTAPHSPIAEAFRALRTNLQFASPDKPLRSLVVTSAGPVEGKTLTSANLAVTLAQAGKRVILVDTDLRRPRVHKLFDIARQPGFTDLVIDQKNGVEAYLQPDGGGHPAGAAMRPAAAQSGRAAWLAPRRPGDGPAPGAGRRGGVRHAPGGHRHRRRGAELAGRRRAPGGESRRPPPRRGAPDQEPARKGRRPGPGTSLERGEHVGRGVL